jgi:hypothetical protein
VEDAYKEFSVWMEQYTKQIGFELDHKSITRIWVDIARKNRKLQ